MNQREEFKKETGLDVEVTINSFSHPITIINPDYVKYLEHYNNILKRAVERLNKSKGNIKP